MAEPTVIKPANLNNVVVRARDVFAKRYYRPLDSALLKAKAASQVLSSAEQDYLSVLRAIRMVDETTTGDAELRSAKDAMRIMIASLESGITELQSMQGWLAPFEDSTSRSLVSLETFTLSYLESVLGSHLKESRGELSHARNEIRAFTFSKAPAPQERAEEVLDKVEIKEPDEDITGMSIETILRTTFGPLHSAAAILDIGRAYAEHAASKLGVAADIMDSSAEIYTDVHNHIEGNDEHAGEAEKILFRLIERLTLESGNAANMRTVSERVTATVARVLESIDEFTVNALRLGLRGEVPEETAPSEDVPMTPPPETEVKPPVDGKTTDQESQASGDDVKTAAMTGCLVNVGIGNIEVVDDFLVDNPDRAEELIKRLDRMARGHEEEESRLNAVKAIASIAGKDYAVATLQIALNTLHALSENGVGDVKSQATACMAELGNLGTGSE